MITIHSIPLMTVIVYDACQKTRKKLEAPRDRAMRVEKYLHTKWTSLSRWDTCLHIG